MGIVSCSTGGAAGQFATQEFISLAKTFRVTERFRADFRAEAFNVFNRVVFGSPQSNLNSSTFGVISSQANFPRQMQGGIKIDWQDGTGEIRAPAWLIVQSSVRMSSLPPPYPAIYAELMRGNLIPFLGAGAPLYDRNPRQTPWMDAHTGQAISYLPTAGELANYLADQTSLPAEERGELTKMAQYYEAVMGPQPLRQRLLDIFSHQQPPTPLHDFLASTPKPLLIVTTNYDDLMERAFQQAGKPFDAVVHMTDRERVLWWEHGKTEPEELLAENLDIELEKVSVIYKMHGAIDRRRNCTGQYVITEDDYIEFLTRMTNSRVIPAIFAEPFQTRPFLFLGYGLYDWNLRVILNRIQEFRRHPKIRSWAIETLSKPLERTLWEARGIKVYDGLTLAQFLSELKKQAAPATGAHP